LTLEAGYVEDELAPDEWAPGREISGMTAEGVRGFATEFDVLPQSLSFWKWMLQNGLQGRRGRRAADTSSRKGR
jgi:hypothetical protein